MISFFQTGLFTPPLKGPIILRVGRQCVYLHINKFNKTHLKSAPPKISNPLPKFPTLGGTNGSQLSVVTVREPFSVNKGWDVMKFSKKTQMVGVDQWVVGIVFRFEFWVVFFFYHDNCEKISNCWTNLFKWLAQASLNHLLSFRDTFIHGAWECRISFHHVDRCENSINSRPTMRKLRGRCLFFFQ